MDPLSDVLSLLRLDRYDSSCLDAGGNWAFDYHAPHLVTFGLVVSGECWLSVEGVPPAHVEPGDCFALPKGLPVRLASHRWLRPTEPGPTWVSSAHGPILSLNGGGECHILGVRFAVTNHQADIVLAALPPLVHIRGETEKAAMRWLMEWLTRETRDPRPGGGLLVQHIAYTMLVQVLRVHLTEGSSRPLGWLLALTDRQINAAMASMHDDPAHPWTLAELAHRAYMSRSTFALKFKERVGVSPIEYLTCWRMRLAADRLQHSSDSISVIATSLGYENESAFSTAFKRVMGCSPRQYGRGSERSCSDSQAR